MDVNMLVIRKQTMDQVFAHSITITVTEPPGLWEDVMGAAVEFPWAA